MTKPALIFLSLAQNILGAPDLAIPIQNKGKVAILLNSK
jgi:hypothetical protein